MKKILLFVILSFLLGFLVNQYLYSLKLNTVPVKRVEPKEKPLLAYTFENLKKTTFPKSAIRLGEVMNETSEVITQMFFFDVPIKPNSDRMATVSGVINLPKESGTYPIIVMFRGYVSEEIYQSGIGTQRVAETLAKHKFITLAPDFLGYGESSPPSIDSFEARFQTYTTALTLFSSLSTLNLSLETSYSASIQADTNKIGIWAHSNGGHIALSVLAISGSAYPTVLWAPVSKSFPYSILFYTDETDDQGKALRKALSLFENDYNTQDYSPERYYPWIQAPLLICQGSADPEVPVQWSNDLILGLEKNDTVVEYKIYPNADHNMLPLWFDAVIDSISFYEKMLID